MEALNSVTYQLPPEQTQLLEVPNTAPFRVSYNRDYNLFVCGLCHEPVAPAVPITMVQCDNVWRHFIKWHFKDPELYRQLQRGKFKGLLFKFYNDNKTIDGNGRLQQLLHGLKTRHFPDTIPIEGVKLFATAFECQEANCRHVCLLQPSMVRHRRRHGLKVPANAAMLDIAKPRPAQVWNEDIYFPVVLPSEAELTPTNEQPPAGTTAQEYRARLKRPLIEVEELRGDGPPNARDISAHEVFAKWRRVWKDVPIKVRPERVVLAHADCEFVPECLASIVDDWFRWACQQCFDSDDCTAVLRRIVMLESVRDTKYNREIKDFATLQERTSEDGYAAHLALLVQHVFLHCGRAVHSVPEPELAQSKARLAAATDNWKLAEDSPLYQAACDAWEIVLVKNDQEEWSELSMSQKQMWNTFIYHLLCRRNMHKDVKYFREPVFRFLVAHHTNTDLRHDYSSVITSGIAKLQFSMRMAFICQHLPNIDRDDFEDRFDADARRVLEPDRSWTVSFLLAQEMTYITANAQPRRTKVVQFVDRKFDKMCILQSGRHPFHITLQEMRQALRSAIGTLSAQLKQVTANFQTEGLWERRNIMDDGGTNRNMYWFADDPQNKELEDASLAFIEHLQRQSPCPLTDVEAQKQFLIDANDTLKTIWFLLFVTTGMPFRCTTWVTTRLRNSSDAVRNLRIIPTDNHLGFIHFYDKTQNGLQKDKLVTKFLPDEVAELVIKYLVLVRPVEASIARDVYGEKTEILLQDFLLVGGGKRWTVEDLRVGVYRGFQTHMRKDLNVKCCRHAMQNWARYHIKEPPESPLVYFINLQFGHSIQTGKSYGVQLHDHVEVSADEQAYNWDVCRLWHALMHLIPAELVSLPQPAVGSDLSRPEPVLGSNCQSTTTIEVIYRTEAEKSERVADDFLCLDADLINFDDKLRTAVSESYKVDKRSSLFRNTKAEGYFTTIWANRHRNYIVVLPTGSGKSSFFQYCSLLESRLVTVVIIPLVAPLQDQISFCERNQMRFTTFSAGLKVDDCAPLLFVQLETMGPAFYEFLKELEFHQRLGRIFVDECHLVLVHSDFRPSFKNLPYLARVPTQKVYMTATLPQPMVPELRKLLVCPNADSLGIGESVIPHNLEFNVRQFIGSSEINEVVKNELQKVDFTSGQRAIIFCPTKEEVETWSGALKGSQCYTGDMNHTEREYAVTKWRECQSQTPVMIATNAFSMGVDYGKVSYIAVLFASGSLMDFIQMAGRGGRDLMTNCKVDFLYKNRVYPALEFHDSLVEHYRDSNRLCRRLSLNYFMNGTAAKCSGIDLKCDVCRGMHWLATKRPIQDSAAAKKDQNNTSTTNMVSVAVERGRVGPDEDWAMIFKECIDEFADICGICFANGVSRNIHMTKHCKTIPGACFGCFQSGHKGSDCPYNRKKYKHLTGACGVCFLSNCNHQTPEHSKENKDSKKQKTNHQKSQDQTVAKTQRNSSPRARKDAKGTGLGTDCPYGRNDFVRSFAISLYHCRKALLRKHLRILNVTGFHEWNFEKYMNWLVTVEHLEIETNMLRLVAQLLWTIKQNRLKGNI